MIFLDTHANVGDVPLLLLIPIDSPKVKKSGMVNRFHWNPNNEYMNSHELHPPTWAIYPSFDHDTSGYRKRTAALEIQYERNIKCNKFTKLDIYSNSLRNLCTATDWIKRWQKKTCKKTENYLVPHPTYKVGYNPAYK